jgi:membrane protein DedA with SNARE-associated domain
MLEGLAQALERFLADWGYIAIFLLMLVEEAGVPLPLPNEVALMYVGYLASKGELNVILAGLAATLGASCGSSLLYTLARRGGRRLVHRYGRFLHINEAQLERAERWVERYGAISVPLARLTPGLRIATTVIAGILRVPFRIVVVAVVGVSLLWSYFWVLVGRLLGDNWEAGARAFEEFGRWIIAVVLLVVLAFFLARRFLRRRNAARDGAGPLATANEPEPKG